MFFFVDESCKTFSVIIIPLSVLFYEISNRERESCVGIMRYHNIQTLLSEMFFFVDESCKTLSAIIIPLSVLFSEISNRERESCVGIMR